MPHVSKFGYCKCGHKRKPRKRDEPVQLADRVDHDDSFAGVVLWHALVSNV